MPVAIALPDGTIPAVIYEETDAALIKRLQALKGAPELASVKDAKAWLYSLPLPSSWHADLTDAKAFLRQVGQPLDADKEEIYAARQELGKTASQFADLLDIGGNDQTRRTEVHNYEKGKKRMNPLRVAKMRAAVALARIGA